MKLCIYGAGAIGGFIGTRLAARGQAVSAVARGATAQALRTHGWRLQLADGLVSAPASVAEDAAILGPQDLVVVAVKAHSLASVARGIAPLLGPDTVVLTAMNGVPWWFFDRFGGAQAGLQLDAVDPDHSIARAIATQHVVGAVVHATCSVPEPGLVHQAQEPQRPERDGLAAGVRAGDDERGVAVAKPDVGRDHAPGEARMAGAEEDDLRPARGLRPDAVHVAGESGLGGPEVELGKGGERFA